VATCTRESHLEDAVPAVVEFTRTTTPGDDADLHAGVTV